MPRVAQDASAKRAAQNKDAFLVSVLENWKQNVATSPQERGKAQACIIEINRRMAARLQDKNLTTAVLFADED